MGDDQGRLVRGARDHRFVMRIAFFAIFITLAFAAAAIAQRCAMDSGGPQKVPCADELLTYDAGKVQKLQGIVTDPNGGRLEGVKLALFRVEGDERVFVGATEGDENGRFCFPSLLKGSYILKVGQGNQPFSGFKCMEVSLTLLPRNNAALQNIKIRMEVGT